MPTLVLKFQDNVIQEFDIQKGQSVNIGRKDNNDLVIENLAVSGYHAKIDSVDDGFLLTDLQSKNGTFINEQMVMSHWLMDGDVITIGKHTLVFSYGEGEEKPKNLEDTMDQTMVMETSKYKNMLAKSSPDVGKQTMETGPVGILTFLAGGSGEVELTKKLTRIGKDPESDIRISGMMVGKTAITVSKRPKGFFINYVGGMAKPKVNGDVVKESRQLHDFDMIEIGPTKMQFTLKS